MQPWWDFLGDQGMSFRRVLGVDEAGRGPLAGPVVVSGVILPRAHGIQGLNDSKLVSQLERQRLYEEIFALSESSIPQKKAEIFIEQASAAQIDRDGILVCTRRLMKRIVKKACPEVALLDAVNVDLYNVWQLALTKGDQRVDCIAAASIVAKVTRDRLMQEFEQKYPGYGLSEHKGYGTAFHRQKIHEKGLSKAHRRSFCGF